MQQPDPVNTSSPERSPGDRDRSTTPLEALASARNLLMAADRACAELRLPDPELDDALTRLRQAHGLLWDLSRRYAAGRAEAAASQEGTGA